MLVFLAFVLIAAVVAATLIAYARWHYGTLEQLGIPVVHPHWLLSSLPDLHTRVQQLQDINRFRKLGPVFGLYEGRSPQIHICDPELVRLIFVKDQDHFREREPIDLGHPVTGEVLDIQPYPEWKMLRSLWTPLFSVGRVKSYAAQEAEIASEHVENMLRKADGGPIRVNARASVTTLLVDFLTQCLHGVRLCDRMEPENVVVRLMKGVLREGVRYDRSYNWTLVYPFLKSFLPPFHTATLDSFHAYVQRLISDRAVAPATPTGAEGKSGKSDYTDMLLGIQRNVREPLGLGLNDLTATAQALELYFGVYDSTGTVLTLLLYYLALNPCAQEQVQEEVNADAEEGADGPESRQLPYLTACLNETMRLTPLFLRAERVCRRDWEAPGAEDPEKHARDGPALRPASRSQVISKPRGI